MRLRIRLGHSLAIFSSLLVRPRGISSGKVTVGWRCYPRSRGGGSQGSGVVNFSPSDPGQRKAATEDRHGTVDRICASITLIVSTILAVAVFFVVAPQLENANPPADSDPKELVATGQQVYRTSCAGCHGSDLKGQVAGAKVAGVQPPPLDASGHAWLHSDGTLFRMVKYGIVYCLGGVTQPEMPNFGDQLDDRSIHAALAFIKSHWPARLRVIQNAFNDGESDPPAILSGALCTPICRPVASHATSPAGSDGVAR
jgi:S-disulfanyl-L-cysteine oxidoreductase SoxD